MIKDNPKWKKNGNETNVEKEKKNAVVYNKLEVII